VGCGLFWGGNDAVACYALAFVRNPAARDRAALALKASYAIPALMEAPLKQSAGKATHRAR